MSSPLIENLQLQAKMLRNFHTLRRQYDKQLRQSVDPDTNELDPSINVQQVRVLTNEVRALTPRTDAAASKSVPTDVPEYHLPRPLLDAYEELIDRAYNMPSAFIGDTNVIHGSGKALRARTSTGQTATRAGAIQKKKLNQSQKTVLKDEQALDIKRKADKKLRAVARDIEKELLGEAAFAASVMCQGCGRIQNTENRYCPHCGRKIK